MKALLIFPAYCFWHYSVALRNMAHLWRNLLWFIGYKFSLGELTRSLFAPWHRITEAPENKFSLESLATALVVNLMSRLVGAVVRLSLILTGLVCFVTALVGGVGVFLVWLLMPALPLGLFVAGVYFLL